MNNIILITSVINTPNKPLSYSKTRSVYNRRERFEQTIEKSCNMTSKIIIKI